MVKGVNKCVIEVADTQNLYFDRAILFVKPEYQQLDFLQLHNQAKLYLHTAQPQQAVRRHAATRRRMLKRGVKAAGIAVLAIAAAGLILFLLLH